MDYPIFIVWKFRESKVIGVYFQGTRDAAPEAAGISELPVVGLEHGRLGAVIDGVLHEDAEPPHVDVLPPSRSIGRPS